MEIRYKFQKKAFAFSFLALFLSILIITYTSVELSKNDYNKDNTFKETRINYINDEIRYFKEVYIQSAFKYCLYNTLNSITQYSTNSTNYATFKQNYTAFNTLMQEGIMFGSFNGVNQSFNQNITINYFYNIFKQDFEKNYKGNFTFKILSLNVFETTPYTISLQVITQYNITTNDNISQWNSIDKFEVNTYISDLKDPQLLILGKQNISTRFAENYLFNQDWNSTTFKKALNETYSSIYFNKKFKYSIGTSFINRLLNNYQSSYKDVMTFLSFDYDDETNSIYDTSQNLNYIQYMGNSKLLFSFDNSTTNSTHVIDLSSYENNGKITGITNCNAQGIRNSTGCKFISDNASITISRNKLNLNTTNTISISAWILPLRYTNPTENSSEIFRYGADTYDVIDLRINTAKKLEMEIGNHSDGQYHTFISNSNITLNQWSHVIGTFDGNTGIGKIYINGFLDNLKDDKFEKSHNLTHFIQSINNISIGNILPLYQESFNGTIDELGIYSKVLTNEEIALLYREKKVLSIDYKDTLHGKGIEFDGKDDYISISTNNYNLNNYSIEIWIKPSLNSSNTNLRQGILIAKNSTKELRFFLNGFGQFEVDLQPNEIGNLVSNFTIKKWQYFTFVFDNGNAKLYRNGKLQDENNSVNMNLNNISTINISWNASANYFNGIIDEVKIYNRTLSKNEITENYYNYDSTAKGCCNYLTLIKPSKFGVNTNSYKQNTSYSSKLFFDYYNRSTNYNITLYSISTISNLTNGHPYYNFMIDNCLERAYDIYSFQNENTTNITINFVKIGTDNVDCSELIKQGIY